MRLRHSISSLVATAVISAGIIAAPGTAMANTNDTVTTTEIMSALNATDASNANLVAESAPSKSDADSAAVLQTDTGSIDIAKDPNDGVTLDVTGGTTVSVGLPNAEDAGTAKKAADGTVVYPASDGSANAVIPTDKGVQMLTTIANSDAPTRYTYPIGLPDGGKVELDGNGVLVLDNDDKIILATSAAWAHDADGVSVPTHFETDGTGITQVVNHTDGNYRYPIVADPFWSTFWAYVGCITGVGVPIGTAIVVASLPATWPFIYRWAANQSAQGDRTIINYVNRVHSACRRFING